MLPAAAAAAAAVLPDAVAAAAAVLPDAVAAAADGEGPTARHPVPAWMRVTARPARCRFRARPSRANAARACCSASFFSAGVGAAAFIIITVVER